MLKIRNLTKVFGGKNKAVDNISLDVKEGEFTDRIFSLDNILFYKGKY